MAGILEVAIAVIRPSRVHGQGLFAGQLLPVGQQLMLLGGRILPWHELVAAGAVGGEWNALAGEWVLFRTARTPYFFINHSRSPNLALDWTAAGLGVFCAETIHAGQELFLDYRAEPLPTAYWSAYGATYL